MTRPHRREHGRNFMLTVGIRLDTVPEQRFEDERLLARGSPP